MVGDTTTQDVEKLWHLVDAELPHYPTHRGHPSIVCGQSEDVAVSIKPAVTISSTPSASRSHISHRVSAGFRRFVGAIATVSASLAHSIYWVTTSDLHVQTTAVMRSGKQFSGRRDGACGVQCSRRGPPMLWVSQRWNHDLLKSGGAKGIRTPDLLDANETRYQLRHSPRYR